MIHNKQEHLEINTRFTYSSTCHPSPGEEDEEEEEEEDPRRNNKNYARSNVNATNTPTKNMCVATNFQASSVKHADIDTANKNNIFFVKHSNGR